MSTQFCVGACPELILPPGAAPQGTLISRIPGISGTGDPAQGTAMSGAAAAHCRFHISPPGGVSPALPPGRGHGHRCTCLPGVVLAAGDPEFTVAKGTR